MTDYIEVLMGRSPKLAGLCQKVEERHMPDAYASKWATYGVHSVFFCGDRVAYQSEILLGAGITQKMLVSLWDGAGAAYLLHFLIHGPEDRFDRKVWKIIGVEPDYSAKIYTPMDFYLKFVWRAASELERRLLCLDAEEICNTAAANAKYVKGRTDLSVYPAFAPDLSGVDTSLTIKDIVERVAGLSDGFCRKLPYELRGEAKYCIERAKQLRGKVVVSEHPDARVCIFSNGERIFGEVLQASEVGGLLPYDIARMRRILQHDVCHD